MNQSYVKKQNEFVEKLKQSPHKWKAESVNDWFENILEFPEYLPQLKKEKVNGESLISLIEKNQFEKIGVTKMGHKKLIQQQIRKMIEKFPKSNPKAKPETKQPGQSEVKTMVNGLYLKKKSCDILETVTDSKKTFLSWSKQDVSIWLRENNLRELVEVFYENNIRGKKKKIYSIIEFIPFFFFPKAIFCLALTNKH